MKINYTLQEAYLALGVDAKTLRSWIHQAKITLHKDENDQRYRLLTRAQMETLALEHNRSLPADLKEQPTAIVLDLQMKSLKKQLGRLTGIIQQQDALITQLQTQINELQEAYNRLEEQYKKIGDQVIGSKKPAFQTT